MDEHRIVRWCPIHKQELVETWDGLACPGGHNSFYAQKMGDEFWVVDLAYPPDDERFCVWMLRDAECRPGAYYERQYDVELAEEAQGTEYLAKPQHWAKPRKLAGRQWNFFQRVAKGRM